jgi:predicted small metal-binding protein
MAARSFFESMGMGCGNRIEAAVTALMVEIKLGARRRFGRILGHVVEIGRAVVTETASHCGAVGVGCGIWQSVAVCDPARPRDCFAQ